MNKCGAYFLIYLKRIYGTSFFRNKDALYIKTDKEIYYVKPHHSEQEKYYFANIETGSTLIDSNFERGLFKVASNSIYKDIGIEPSVEDWNKFLADAQKYKY